MDPYSEDLWFLKSHIRSLQKSTSSRSALCILIGKTEKGSRIEASRKDFGEETTLVESESRLLDWTESGDLNPILVAPHEYLLPVPAGARL
jgi:hypothetical protein